MALPKLEGHVTIATGGAAVSVAEVGGGGTIVVTVAAGDYFPTSTTALLSTFQTALNDSALSGTYTVTLDDTTDSATGKVTISATGITTFAITWTSTSLRDALGFTGNTSAALTTTGASSCPYVFLPNVKRMPAMAPDGYRGMPVTDGTITMSPSGIGRGIRYATRYVDSLGFAFLLGSKTWITHETVTNESLQKFYETTIAKGCPIRYHPDRSDDATYASYRVRAISSLSVVPSIPTWTSGAQSLWTYGPVAVDEYVTS